MENDENQFCTFLWEKKGILLLVSFLPTTQVRFFNILILLFYFKWCWASDGAANDRVSKERGCAKIIEKIPFFFCKHDNKENRHQTEQMEINEVI